MIFGFPDFFAQLVQPVQGLLVVVVDFLVEVVKVAVALGSRAKVYSKEELNNLLNYSKNFSKLVNFVIRVYICDLRFI